MAKDLTYAQYLLQYEQRTIAKTGKLPYLPPGVKVVTDGYKAKPTVIGVLTS